jgi:hypothetical protein
MGLAFFLSNAAVISITTVPKLGNLILQVRRKHRPPSKRKYIERLLVQYSTVLHNPIQKHNGTSATFPNRHISQPTAF